MEHPEISKEPSNHLVQLSPTQEKNVVKQLIRKAIQEGETFYVVSKKWFLWWSEYVDLYDTGESAERPGEIDNQELCEKVTEDTEEQLREGL